MCIEPYPLASLVLVSVQEPIPCLSEFEDSNLAHVSNVFIC
jgi:hypothetical protein